MDFAELLGKTVRKGGRDLVTTLKRYPRQEQVLTENISKLLDFLKNKAGKAGVYTSKTLPRMAKSKLGI